MIKFIFILLLPLCVYSQGSFKVSSGINIVSTNNPHINLYNTDLYNNTGNSDFTDGVIWGLTGDVSIFGTTIQKFNGLRLNNPAGLVLSANIIITDILEMVDGDIDINGHTLEIGTSPTNPGTIDWSGGTINGPLKRWFAASTNSTQASGIFPIGNDATNRNVVINYTQAPSVGGYIIVEYKTGIPPQVDEYAGLPLWTPDGKLIQNYENNGYFEITPDDYNSPLNNSAYTIKMRGVNLTTVDDYNIIRLIKNAGPSHSGWTSCGSHSLISGTNSDITVTSTNVTGFSWFNFGSQNNNPLPVELLYFDGVKYPTFNMLKWSTASEHNSSYFDVERSIDGIEWRVIGTKTAAVNSNTQLNYSYLDAINQFTIHYYRLVQYDIDGKFEIYGPIALDNSNDKQVVKYINLAGQEVGPETKGIVFEIYNDGTSKKTIR